MTDKVRSIARKQLKVIEDDEQSSFVPTRKHDKYQRWSQAENTAYVQYLKNHLDQFIIKKGKKRKNLFMNMSDQIDCQRDNEQCRTHHEKMMKKFKTVENIIQDFELSAGKRMNGAISESNESQVLNETVIKVKKPASFSKRRGQVKIKIQEQKNEEKKVKEKIPTVIIQSEKTGNPDNGDGDDARPPPILNFPDFLDSRNIIEFMEVQTPDPISRTPFSTILTPLNRTLMSPNFMFR